MKKLLSLTYLIIITAFLSFAGCEEDKGIDPDTTQVTTSKVNSCEGCHTNYDHLKAVADEEEPPGDEGHGCGGPPPYYPPYDRVYMGGEGYATFKAGIHGQLDCVTCHNGVDDTDDKNLAHSGNFINKPSHNATEKCAGCHADIVKRTENSLQQQGWGQKRMVVQRSGYGTHPTDFDNLPDGLKEGYEKNC